MPNSPRCFLGSHYRTHKEWALDVALYPVLPVRRFFASPIEFCRFLVRAPLGYTPGRHHLVARIVQLQPQPAIRFKSMSCNKTTASAKVRLVQSVPFSCYAISTNVGTKPSSRKTHRRIQAPIWGWSHR